MIPRRIPFFAPNSIGKLIWSLNKELETNEGVRLERDLQKILGLPNPIVLGRGRVGLKLILESLNIKPGSEIIMPGYTFGVLTKVVRNAGFTPIPVDIDKATLQMSPQTTAKAITKRTSVILATHLFGEPCSVYEFKKLAKKHNLYLIEDCAQSLGATLDDKLTGTFGDIAFSSFDIAKPLQGIRGGVVFSKNKKLIDKIRKLRDLEKGGQPTPLAEIIKGLFGYYLTQTPIWFILMFLVSFKKPQKMFVQIYRQGVENEVPYILPPIFAELTRRNLSSLKARLIKRRRIRDKYSSLLSPSLTFQKTEKGSTGSVYMILAKTNFNIFELRRYLSLKGIDIGLGDEIADNCLKSPKSNVKQALKHWIALPIYENLSDKDILKIAKAINDFRRF